MLVVIDNILSAAEAAHFCTVLEPGPWESGHTSAGTLAGQVKQNAQLQDHAARDPGADLLSRLHQNPQFVSAALPLRAHPPRFNRYSAGQYYGTHVDSAVMPLPDSNDLLRSDLAGTLFLSPPEDYTGGALQIEGEFGVQQIRLGSGALVLYPSSSLHRVEPVTHGVRLAAVFWFQSMVPDAAARAMLYDLDQSIQTLTETGADDDSLVRLSGLYHNLLRRWAHT